MFTSPTLIRLLYQLPHPLPLMKAAQAKETFKAMVKKAVVGYWGEKKLLEASAFGSLKYFQPI